ncbi:MAG: hypothetical protein QNJ90_03640 [Planctomycetota bacterium]|nr:hypothetical protein [Planctomycetota bacterium]
MHRLAWFVLPCLTVLLTACGGGGGNGDDDVDFEPILRVHERSLSTQQIAVGVGTPFEETFTFTPSSAADRPLGAGILLFYEQNDAAVSVLADVTLSFQRSDGTPIATTTSSTLGRPDQTIHLGAFPVDGVVPADTSYRVVVRITAGNTQFQASGVQSVVQILSGSAQFVAASPNLAINPPAAPVTQTSNRVRVHEHNLDQFVQDDAITLTSGSQLVFGYRFVPENPALLPFAALLSFSPNANDSVTVGQIDIGIEGVVGLCFAVDGTVGQALSIDPGISAQAIYAFSPSIAADNQDFTFSSTAVEVQVIAAEQVLTISSSPNLVP